ncbi:DUF1838 domain-containing protein [Parahaliea maris]|uniref:DUF1838 domain-containing protein n=1 Tax=Parahaliea maris TaxID=2716870 RepID=A0A5C8ZVT5_9GAMM|nr:DUF1838 family protein [Parahaliea maris]TXS91969.1 DUF1838 domain-containing protein [Parahaliea maris]
MASRRDLLKGMAGAAAMATGGVALAAPPALRESQLDVPEDNLRAYIKLRGDLEPVPVYELIRGQVMGLVRGEKPRELFKTMGAQRTVYRRVSALEYQADSRYIGLLLDWSTEQLLTSWKNPYNNRDCKVPATHYDTTFRLFSDASAMANSSAEPSRGCRPWHLVDGVLHMHEQAMSPGPAAKLPDADLMTFTGDWREMIDPNITRARSRLNFTAIENWRDWMHMEQEGSLWWHVSGVKLSSPGAFPAALVPLILDQEPDFFKG